MSNIHEILGAIGREHPPAGLRDRILQACEQAESVEEISCAEALELASAYLDDELPGSRRDAFEAHVFTCDSCYAAFKQMERTTELLRETPRATAPADLHQRIAAAVARDAAPQPIFTWRRAAATLGGLAAAAALLAAVFVPRGDVTDSSAPVIAEAPPEVAGAPADNARVADEPVEPEAAVEETPEGAITEPAGETAVATDAVREARTVRSTAPRTSVAREELSEPTPAPERANVSQPEPAREDSVSTPAPQPRPVRNQPATQPGRNADQPDARERRTPRPQPQPEPVTADERPTPTPVRERTPEISPEPPARAPQPRETVIAATPRRDPQPASAPGTTPEPAATSSTSRPADTTDREATRVASVVPTQAPVRARYQPEPTSISERSERLARMNAGINGSQTPALDNPTMGIELN